MNLKYKVIIPLGLVALLAAGCNKTVSISTYNSNNQPSVSGNTSTPAQTGQKLSDQPYFSYAYLISGSALDTNAQKALAGFQMSKTALPDGTTQITLKALNPEYQDQQYVLEPGQQLYFIDKFLADDDSAANLDNNFSDDTAVIVDSQGYLVGQPAGWTQNSQNSQNATP